MRTKSKWLAILLALGMVLAACGTGGTTTTTAAQTTTTAGGGGDTTTTTAAPTEIKTDIGVDLEAGTITVGLLSDLTGPFGPLVSAIVAGQQAYWADVNANGGINGLTVNLEVRDTVYDATNHVQFYEELKEQVVAFGHSTGTPHTIAIAPQLAADGILAIPLTWYSGWSDPAINANVVPHGTPYCIEAMNTIEYLVENSGVDSPTIAIASIPGDYGLDSMAGAVKAAAALGIDVVYDGSAKLIPGQEPTYDEVAAAIVASEADLVFVTATPGVFSGVYGRAIAQGFQATWSGAAPSWNPAFIAEGSPIRDAIARDFVGSFYADLWGGDSEGAQKVAALMGEAPPTDYYGEGFIEAIILHQVLLSAYANGDLTQAGVLAAAKSLESVDFGAAGYGGLGPNESYVGEPNDIVQRKTNIFRVDLTKPTGSSVVERDFTSDIAAAYEFTEACFKLEG